MSEVDKEPKKKKKVDMKAWQRKWLKPNASQRIPDKFGGFGDGKGSKCSVCDRVTRAGKLKGDGLWYCGDCK